MAHFTRAFRHRNYQLFFGGQLISLTGTWMQAVAESWLVYRLTGSSALLGATSFVTLVPVFLFATIGGTVADRRHRHRIILTTQTAAMLLTFVLAALTLSGRVQVWHVFVLATCLGVVNAFDIPARQAFVVEMVGREDLSNAIALNSTMVNGARVVGPAIAGAVVALVGEGWCFLLNAVSYIAVIAGLLLMRVPPRPRPAARTSALRETLEGFRFVARTAPVRALLLLLGRRQLRRHAVLGADADLRRVNPEQRIEGTGPADGGVRPRFARRRRRAGDAERRPRPRAMGGDRDRAVLAAR